MAREPDELELKFIGGQMLAVARNQGGWTPAPTMLECLAEEAGLDVEDVRQYLRDEVADRRVSGRRTR